MNAKFYLLIVLASLSVAHSKTWSNITVERPLLVGAFNIQNLGSSKLNNATIMSVVKKILSRYDLILIQEIVTTETNLITNIVQDINKSYANKGEKFMIEISERLGRGTAKEQYAYLYKSDKFKLKKRTVYPDQNDDFMRPPFIVHFDTPTLRDLKTMVVVGIHTQPKYAANETSALADVYDFAVKTFKTENVMIMGDMNAGCGNVRISDWNNIELWKREEFTWLITHDLDTTLSLNCCPYDRIVIAGEDMENAIIWDSVNIYKYRDIYGLSTEMALAISDHWPVEVRLKGGTSELARNNLKSTLCLTIDDKSEGKLPTQLRNQKSTLGFSIFPYEDSTELYKESVDDGDILESFKKLRAKYPDLISLEASDALTYKVEHGALKDVTSHDVPQNPLYSISVLHDSLKSTIAVQYCCITTIN